MYLRCHRTHGTYTPGFHGLNSTVILPSWKCVKISGTPFKVRVICGRNLPTGKLVGILMLSHNSFASLAHPFARNSPYLSRFILVATNTSDTVYSQQSRREVCILRMRMSPRRSRRSFWPGFCTKRDVLFSSGVALRENSVFTISKC